MDEEIDVLRVVYIVYFCLCRPESRLSDLMSNLMIMTMTDNCLTQNQMQMAQQNSET
jgi:hypothetical protein